MKTGAHFSFIFKRSRVCHGTCRFVHLLYLQYAYAKHCETVLGRVLVPYSIQSPFSCDAHHCNSEAVLQWRTRLKFDASVTISCLAPILDHPVCFLASCAALISAWRWACFLLSSSTNFSSLRLRHLKDIPFAIAFKTSASLDESLSVHTCNLVAISVNKLQAMRCDGESESA